MIVRYSLDDNWTEGHKKFANVTVRDTTIIIDFPVAECNVQIDIIGGFYTNDVQYATHELFTINKKCEITEKLFEKNIYYVPTGNVFTIKSMRYNNLTNTASALKFTALTQSFVDSVDPSTTIESITKFVQVECFWCE